ncbi:hypothetical protein ATE84_2876 [Aquimarina sp. MAR_2010_214]|uniref:hypothetical protein n=1 Tax=Aquimarina sp. MAR_2010_214 TaxID=1250026 RepID=UPI000C70AB2B|nr:hypothetical protein [Aquimarina sp. MAR_2010_214]PKV50809.1 hypothetical protein ATE84_2876 [Aquimarina sp. MAR_2010_214]
MDYEDAKKISLPHLLQQLGHQPLQGKGSAHKLWYKSPLRVGDDNPSFKVELKSGGYVWYDFGLGKGGNIFSFVKEYINDESFGAVMAFLRPYATLNTNVNVTHEVYSKDVESGITIESIKPLQHPALINYLSSRKIPKRVATMELISLGEKNSAQTRAIVSEVNYSVNSNDKIYFTLGFQNDKVGFELRNKYNKLSCSPKYFTTFKGQNHTTIEIFEGFFDFMSAIVIGKYKDALPNDVLVLNSLSFVPRAIEFIEANDYQTIITWLDTKAEDARKLFTPLTSYVHHKHLLYANYDDLNDWLVKDSFKSI